MSYKHITDDERVQIIILRNLKWKGFEIAKYLGRHPSTISREMKRNVNVAGCYTIEKARERAAGRKKRCRKKILFSKNDFKIIKKLLEKKWSPEQISGVLKLLKILSISHETIYQYIIKNIHGMKEYSTYLRQACKQRRKRHNTYNSRGRVPNKKCIDERPIGAKNRSRSGHYEIDTVNGAAGTTHCLLTLTDRKEGHLIVKKLESKKNEEVNKVLLKLFEEYKGVIKSITADNGVEFHGYEELERKTGIPWYFARPYHSWERGSNENANGLIRQYIPKGKSMVKITQKFCDWIQEEINNRPRKRYGYLSPNNLYYGEKIIALQT